jgi:hypothetical protein
MKFCAGADLKHSFQIFEAATDRDWESRPGCDALRIEKSMKNGNANQEIPRMRRAKEVESTNDMLERACLFPGFIRTPRPQGPHGRAMKTSKSLLKSGVPSPVTGSQPLTASKPFVPHPGLLPVVICKVSNIYARNELCDKGGILHH